MTDFHVTKECESVLRTSLREVRERITDGAKTKLQRRHTSVVDWNGRDGQRHEAKLRTVVTNPVGTETLKARIDVMLPTTIVDESLHGRLHSLSDAGYGAAEDALNALLEDELSTGRGSTTVRLTSPAVATPTFSYYGEVEVRF